MDKPPAMWFCCRCHIGHSIATTPACVACGHRQCTHCCPYPSNFGVGRENDGSGHREASASGAGLNFDFSHGNDDLYLEDSAHLQSELQQDDFSPILNPGAHFSSLEELEAEVVAKCGISGYSLVDGVVNATMPSERFGMDECIDNLNGIIEAFKLLQKRGFCSSHFNVLVQDPHRHEVALAIPISGVQLEDLLNKARSENRSTSILNTAYLDAIKIEAVSEPQELYRVLFDVLETAFATGTCAEHVLHSHHCQPDWV
jgi:hypothetical protein